MESPTVSVIVCVYNVENTIRKALDSYLAQTFTNFEMIIVDDGSTDNSGTICEEYANKDSRIRLFHKINEGVAMARSYALKRISGKYVIHFDPDDWMDVMGLECLYDKAKEEDADMVICDYYHNDATNQTYTIQKPTTLDHYSVLGDVISGKLYGYSVNKLIKVDCIRKYKIDFPKELRIYEDQYFICDMLLNDIKIAYLPMAFYHYVFNPNGLTRHYDGKSFDNAVLARRMFYELLAGTEYQNLAWDTKTSAIAAGAFIHGGKIYTSKVFKEKFAEYKDTTLNNERSLFLRQLYKLAFKGHYQLAHHIYMLTWMVKMVLNKLKS